MGAKPAGGVKMEVDMKTIILIAVMALFLIIPTLSVAEENPSGELLFNNYCAMCHGMGALGTDKGPPLVHKFYEPNHHDDYSFHRAVRNGVRQHHWNFGNMPPTWGIRKEEVDMIIRYVRGLQKETGLF